MKRTNWFLLGILTTAAASLALSGCATAPTTTTTTTDEKAPKIVLRGLYTGRDDKVGVIPDENGIYAIKTGMSYFLVADIVVATVQIVKVERRLLWWGGFWPSGSTSFFPLDVSGKNDHKAYTPWSFNSPTEGSGQHVQLEMWAVDSNGRRSNTVSIEVVTSR